MAGHTDPRTVVPLHLPSVLPDYAPLFPFSRLNPMQSVCFDQLVNAGTNVCVSAPTGSGKTLLFELGIVRLLMAPPPLGKTVYLAPLRALAAERAADWAAKFAPRGAFRGLAVALMVGGEGEEGEGGRGGEGGEGGGEGGVPAAAAAGNWQAALRGADVIVT